MVGLRVDRAHMRPRIDTVQIASLEEYRSYRGSSHRIEERRRAFERGLVRGRRPFSVSGVCGVCARRVSFRVDFRYAFEEVDGKLQPNWREQLVCPKCGLNNRMRATLELVEELLAPRDDSRIFITEQLTPIYRLLSSRYRGMVGSEYLGDRVPRGETDARGIRNEDLTRLTFPTESFDLAISLDVLEHVPEVSRALAELARVLRPGGRLLVSVPFLPDRRETLVRARIDEAGEIEHLMPPEYHGDPLRAEGCLAFYHFGWQLLNDLVASGFAGATAHLFWSSELGHLGRDQLMFVADKRAGLESGEP